MTTPSFIRTRPPIAVVLALALVVLYELQETAVFPPTVRLLEDAICRQHYARTDPGVPVIEAMCKTGPIQSELAFIRGWLSLFKTAPGGC